jgi:hypothetical protein
MSPKVTVGLVVVLAALGSYVYFYELQEDDEANESLSIYGSLYDEYDIVELEIVNSQRMVHFVRTNGSLTRDWAMVQPSPLPAVKVDQARVNGAATRLGRLTASQIITNVTNLALYGLASPELTVTLTISNGQKVRLYTGHKTPVNDNRYLRLAPEDQSVYLVFSFAVDDLHNLIDILPRAPTPLPSLVPNSSP